MTRVLPVRDATRSSRCLPREFYARDARAVAPDLLNKVLVRRLGSDHKSPGVELRGRVVEVEAYGGSDDPASHAYRGMTRRNAVMFGPPGFLYVYFSYGVHWCANAVCESEGAAAAVLIRAVEPISGLEAMRIARGGNRRDRDLTNGPAKLCQAFGLSGSDNGVDLAGSAASVSIVDDGVVPPRTPFVGARIGISSATDERWRWCVPGNAHVSKG